MIKHIKQNVKKKYVIIGVLWHGFYGCATDVQTGM